MGLRLVGVFGGVDSLLSKILFSVLLCDPFLGSLTRGQAFVGGFFALCPLTFLHCQLLQF